MRINKDGTRNIQDLPIQGHAAALGIDMAWHGTKAETAAYYGRLTIPFESFANLKQTDFDRYFNPAKLQAVLDAINALAEEVTR